MDIKVYALMLGTNLILIFCKLKRNKFNFFHDGPSYNKDCFTIKNNRIIKLAVNTSFRLHEWFIILSGIKCRLLL